MSIFEEPMHKYKIISHKETMICLNDIDIIFAFHIIDGNNMQITFT